MNQRSTLLVVIGLLISSLISAQDIHFTNYYYSPLYLSPAKTGAFAGTFRFGAQVREQFSSFIDKPYRTLTAYADMPLALGLKPHHWIGVGINLHADEAGDLDLQNTGAHLSASYHLALDPKYKTVFTLGLQFGMIRKSINGDNYKSAETLNGNINDPDRNLLNDFNPSIGDFNVGLSFKRWTSKTSYIDLGTSMYHLLQAEYEFTGSQSKNTVARRMNFFAAYHIQTNKQLAIKPVLVYSRMIKFQNLFGQVNFEYKINKKSDTLLKAGLGYRTGDALQFLAGVVYKGWDVGIAYDLTVSTAKAFNNGYGGLELGMRKIIITNKKPKIIPVLLCPRY